MGDSGIHHGHVQRWYCWRLAINGDRHRAQHGPSQELTTLHGSHHAQLAVACILRKLIRNAEARPQPWEVVPRPSMEEYSRGAGYRNIESCSSDGRATTIRSVRPLREHGLRGTGRG